MENTVITWPSGSWKTILLIETAKKEVSNFKEVVLFHPHLSPDVADELTQKWIKISVPNDLKEKKSLSLKFSNSLLLIDEFEGFLDVASDEFGCDREDILSNLIELMNSGVTLVISNQRLGGNLLPMEIASYFKKVIVK